MINAVSLICMSWLNFLLLSINNVLCQEFLLDSQVFKHLITEYEKGKPKQYQISL